VEVAKTANALPARIYLACLAHASYLIADGGEAAVVDPQRDVDQYLEAARRGER